MSKCPYCGVAAGEKFNFCTECERQVRCAKCGEDLLPKKTKCLVCGTPLVEQQPTASAGNGNQQINRYTFKEKQSGHSASREISLEFTDNAIEKAGSLFGGVLPLRMPSMGRGGSPTSKPALAPAPAQSEGDVIDYESGAQAADATRAPEEQQDQALEYFEKDARGYLMAKHVDYKGKSKKEQQERFILIYSWAYGRIYNGPVPAKRHLIDAAKSNGIYDRNFDTYLPKTARHYLIDIGNGLKLKPAASLKVEEILGDIKDSNKAGFIYWNGASKSPSPKVAGQSKADEQAVEQWLSTQLPELQFDVRSMHIALHWAMFALYDITNRVKAVQAVRSSVAYLYITKRYKTVPVSKDRFMDIMKRNHHADKFKKTKDGEYYLTPEAEKTVEAWVSGTRLPEAPSSAKQKGSNASASAA